MKTGYHFTTWETYQAIREVGLKPMPWERRHEDSVACVRKFIEDGCIWVYTRRQSLDKILGIVFYVAIHHLSHRIVRLAVDYDDWQAASYHALREINDPEVSINLVHNLGDAGPFNHDREPFDLLITPITSEHIRLAGRWNLRQFVRDGLSQPSNTAKAATPASFDS